MENGKTVREFYDAVPLSDEDFLAIYQPNLFNIALQRNGDTRKVTIANFLDYIKNSVTDHVIREYQRMYVGFGVDFLGKTPPSSYQLAKMRIIELTGQILPIALYQELCDMNWVGAEANNLSTTYFWYKCDANGTRNVNGLYMKFADWRGMFPRVAGANATLRTDMNNPSSPPYDGGNIGSFHSDTVAIPNGSLEIYRLENGSKICINAAGSFSQELFELNYPEARVSAPNLFTPAMYQRILFNVLRSGYETAGAWGAVVKYVTY